MNRPGFPSFMERAIRDNQFIIIICTPRYKRRSDEREGGVGYEGDIMTAEVMTHQNHRKFIPVLRGGPWGEAAPAWLAGKYYIDLSSDPYAERDYEDLVRTLLGIRETAPPLGMALSTVPDRRDSSPERPSGSDQAEFEDITITRVIVEEITELRNDGTRGSALYAIPFALSRRPPVEWIPMFVDGWNHPPRWTSMHRPGIARVSGATVWLEGTTIDEVENYHRDTLQLAIAEANKRCADWQRRQTEHRVREQAARDERRVRVEDVSKRIRFD